MANQHLLDVLQTHGELFLNSFTPVSRSVSKNRKIAKDITSPKRSKCTSEPEWEDEWSGIFWGSRDDIESKLPSSDVDNTPEVVLFQDTYDGSERSNVIKAQKKAFMSSKVSWLDKKIDPHMMQDEEANEDYTNFKNDVDLHRLIHTQLLSGSSDLGFEIPSARRKKALAGRVLELSGAARLGQGERLVRETERNKASKRVRMGLISNQKAKAKRELGEAQALGNYHPSIKRQFREADPHSSRRRIRGLKMGVGKFSGGQLKLSNGEISAVEGRSRSLDTPGPGSSSGKGGRLPVRA